MPRLVALLAACAACAGRPPPVANRAASTIYKITPITVAGGEGMHSAAHSQTMIGGHLEVVADRAVLSLDLVVDRTWVHCNFDGVSTLQACAPPDATDQHTSTRLTFTGSVHRHADALAFALGRTTLACRETGATLACRFGDDFGVFGPLAKPVALELVR